MATLIENANRIATDKENIRQAIADGYTDIWDLAEHLNVDEAFLKEALQYYGYLSA